jgi:hypothetical protein
MDKIDFKKQFFIFSFADYYPSGGLNDVRGTYDTLEEAKQACTDDSIFISDSACFVWDKLSGKIVFNLYE